MSQASKPPGFVQGVIISPKIAYIIETRADLTALRTSIRGEDSELDTALNALRWAAMQWAASVNGRQSRKATEAEPDLKHWYTPGELAGRTNVSEHAIRLAIREDRLPATKRDGRWQIAPADFAIYIAHHHPRR